MDTNTISRLRMLDLYQDNDNDDVPITTKDIIKNIIEEVHSSNIGPRIPSYNIGKLNLDIHTMKGTTVGPVLQKQGQRNEEETRPHLSTGQQQNPKESGIT